MTRKGFFLIFFQILLSCILFSLERFTQEYLVLLLNFIIYCSFYSFNTAVIENYSNKEYYEGYYTDRDRNRNREPILSLIIILIADETYDKSSSKYENGLSEAYIFGVLKMH